MTCSCSATARGGNPVARRMTVTCQPLPPPTSSRSSARTSLERLHLVSSRRARTLGGQWSGVTPRQARGPLHSTPDHSPPKPRARRSATRGTATLLGRSRRLPSGRPAGSMTGSSALGWDGSRKDSRLSRRSCRPKTWTPVHTESSCISFTTTCCAGFSVSPSGKSESSRATGQSRASLSREQTRTS